LPFAAFGGPYFNTDVFWMYVNADSDW